MASAADTVFVGGRVFSAPATQPVQLGVAVRGGRIAAVAPDDELRDLVGTATEVVDLAGGLLIPGFQDAHVHPVMGGVDLLRCDLHDAVDAEDSLAKVGCLRRRQPRPRVDRRRRLVDVALRQRHADPRGPRRRRARPAGLPDQQGRPRHLGEQRGARAGGDRRLDARPGGRTHRAPTGRLAQRHAARGGGAARRPAAARRHSGPAGRRAPDGSGDDVLPRHHRRGRTRPWASSSA